MQRFQRDPNFLAAYQFALGEFGTVEAPGEESNPRVIEYLNTTGLSPVTNDDIHWCSAFVNWCVIQADVESTGSPRARSWETWGDEVIDSPQPGDIVVLDRGSNPALGHVGFYDFAGYGLICLLGGNQNDRVCKHTYNESRIVTIRTLYA